jgi:hypothetical protein
MMSDLGSLSYFLGIEIASTADGYYLSQSKYIQELIAHSGLTNTWTAATPMELNLHLKATDGLPLEDPTRYRHLIGSLVYLTATRLDLAYAVHTLGQFVSAPTTVHYAICFVFCAIKGGQSRDNSFMLHLVSRCFMLILMLLGPVIMLIVFQLPDIVSFLVARQLHGSLSGNLRFLGLAQKLN